MPLAPEPEALLHLLALLRPARHALVMSTMGHAVAALAVTHSVTLLAAAMGGLRRLRRLHALLLGLLLTRILLAVWLRLLLRGLLRVRLPALLPAGGRGLSLGECLSNDEETGRGDKEGFLHDAYSG